MTAQISALKIVSAENAQAAAKLSAAIGQLVLVWWDGEVPPSDPQDALDQFVDHYWDLASRINLPDSHPWHQSLQVEIAYESTRVLCLALLNSTYAGGAQGTESLTYANFRPGTGEAIHLTDIFLADIFKAGYAKPLNALGERHFRELKGLSPQASLKAAGFNFPGDHFRLNENFAIGADGLTFYFNTQEIASTRAAGPTKLFLLYTDIHDLLRPDANIP